MPITRKIPKVPAGGKRWVIPDLHGCCKTFEVLISQLKLDQKDQLFLLGDYIDRGPDSQGVLDYIMWLQNLGFFVFCLRGNHEQRLLDYLEEGYPELYVTRNGLLGLMDAETLSLKPKYRDFLKGLYYYFELEDCFLVHAGFNFEHNDPLTDTDSMLWIRDFDPDPHFYGGKRIIHGHTVTPLMYIKEDIKDRDQVIPLDNGCVYANRREIGNLLALCLDDFSLIVQPNVEGL